MTSEDRFDEIVDSEIFHSSFFSKEDVMNCMKKTYNMAIEDVLNWLSNHNHLSDNVNYLKEECLKKFLKK